MGIIFLLALAVPVHSSPAGIPETVLNEILLQKGEDVIIEKMEGKYVCSLWIGRLHLKGVFEVTKEKKPRLVIYGVSHAKRLNTDNTIAFEWSAPSL